jgi:hypothetical protein
MSGWGEIDGDVSRGNVVSAVLESGLDTVTAFANRSIGKTDCVEVIFVGLDAGNVNFYFNNVGVDSYTAALSVL